MPLALGTSSAPPSSDDPCPLAAGRSADRLDRRPGAQPHVDRPLPAHVGLDQGEGGRGPRARACRWRSPPRAVHVQRRDPHLVGRPPDDVGRACRSWRSAGPCRARRPRGLELAPDRLGQAAGIVRDPSSALPASLANTGPRALHAEERRRECPGHRGRQHAVRVIDLGDHAQPSPGASSTVSRRSTPWLDSAPSVTAAIVPHGSATPGSAPRRPPDPQAGQRDHAQRAAVRRPEVAVGPRSPATESAGTGGWRANWAGPPRPVPRPARRSAASAATSVTTATARCTAPYPTPRYALRTASFSARALASSASTILPVSST